MENPCLKVSSLFSSQRVKFRSHEETTTPLNKSSYLYISDGWFNRSERDGGRRRNALFGFWVSLSFQFVFVCIWCEWFFVFFELVWGLFGAVARLCWTPHLSAQKRKPCFVFPSGTFVTTSPRFLRRDLRAASSRVLSYSRC